MPTRSEVYAAIDGERDYQDNLGEDRTDGVPKGVGDFLTMMDAYLRKAQDGYIGQAGNEAALEQIRKVVAIGVQVMEAHGAPRRDLGDLNSNPEPDRDSDEDMAGPQFTAGNPLITNDDVNRVTGRLMDTLQLRVQPSGECSDTRKWAPLGEHLRRICRHASHWPAPAELLIIPQGDQRFRQALLSIQVSAFSILFSVESRLNKDGIKFQDAFNEVQDLHRNKIVRGRTPLRVDVFDCRWMPEIKQKASTWESSSYFNKDDSGSGLDIELLKRLRSAALEMLEIAFFAAVQRELAN